MNWLTPHDTEMIVRLLVAVLCGGLIGLEREVHGKTAGFRTHSLVAIGSALVMIVSIDIFELYKGVAVVDPSRIAAQIVTGVGFLGAGAIIRFSAGIKGLTTAAGIWVAAGIGMASGAGFFKPAIVTTLFTLLVLVGFSWIGRKLKLRDV